LWKENKSDNEYKESWDDPRKEAKAKKGKGLSQN
jgi:hypothetical protein